mmetsp:Transcript_27114/g.43555  ORF Transcript_27114/g.43555 Transcript_27114/m.43555 type:complete len:87 (+) Transcript_27114:121-381(+)
MELSRMITVVGFMLLNVASCTTAAHLREEIALSMDPGKKCIYRQRLALSLSPGLAQSGLASALLRALSASESELTFQLREYRKPHC